MSQTERDIDESIDALDGEFDEFDGSPDRDDAAEVAAAAERDPSGELDASDAERIDSEPDDEHIDDEEFELPEIVMATEDDDDDLDDDAPMRHLPVGDPLLRAAATAEVSAAERAPATTETPATDRAPVTEQAPVMRQAPVSDDVLDELRSAQVDGPIVALAPQDDNSRTIRRPRRAPDHDPSPFPIAMSVPRVLGRKPRVRRVTRVVRHVDPWSVFKIAFVANILLYFTLLVAGVLLWNVAYATGTVDNVERFFESFGWSSFEFDGGEIYHNAWIGGIFVVIGLTGFAVLMAALFNLITDLVGGMRFTVLEEEVVEARPSPMRRFVVRRAEPEVPAVTYDASGPIVREAIVDESGQIPR